MTRAHTLFLVTVLSASIAAAAPPPTKGGGLTGLGSPGSLSKTTAKTAAFELDVAQALNRVRAKSGAPALVMDERLRLFSRREAELATQGEIDAKAGSERLQKSGLAGEAHRIQYGYGDNAARVIASMLENADVKAGLLGEFTRLGVGAFWLQAEKPVFQVTIVVARDTDPKAGQPGLLPEQTDPVMRAAEPRIRACYEAALAKNPNLRGEVVVQIAIGAGGEVAEAKLLKSLNSEAFDGCALQIARDLKFPAPYKGKLVTLNQPMRFEPQHGEKRVGLLTPEQLSSGFAIAQADFRACYDQRVAKKPKLAGALELALTVATDGSVANATITADSMHDDELARCVLDRARTLHFAKPQFDAPVDITYPLRFAPSSVPPG